MPPLTKRKSKQILSRLKAETQQVSLPATGKKPSKHIALPKARSKMAESRQDGARQLRLDDYVVSFTTWADGAEEVQLKMAAGGGFERASKLVAKKAGDAEEKSEKEETKLVLRLDETQEAIAKMDIDRPLLI
ncbi:hypothetical protein LPJ56_001176, partial [Coemansia sp. RSA 2599]